MLSLSNDPSCHSVHFELLADAEPGLLPRTLAPFAKRDLVPDRVHVRRDGTALLVEIGMEAMPSEMMHLVEGNLRQIVGVRRVTAVLCEERRWAA